VTAQDGAVVVHTAVPTRDVHTLTGWALDHGLELPTLTLTRPTLEDVYLRLTGEAADGQ
jgi:ABC-2 type transport system ATP-binding protein